jgi:cell division protein FtsA
MTTEHLVAGLDIGSAKTTAIIAEVVGELPKHPGLRVLGVGQARTTGMRRGMVSDIEETTRSIRRAVQDAERMAGAQVSEVYAGIAGEHVQAMTSKGIVAVSGEEIERDDVERAEEVARALEIPRDRELLHAIPQEYTVDRNGGVRDPVGMIGTRLETEMYLVTIGSSPAVNLRKAVDRAGYTIKHLVLEPLASALAVLTEDEKELGVALEGNPRFYQARVNLGMVHYRAGDEDAAREAWQACRAQDPSDARVQSYLRLLERK